MTRMISQLETRVASSKRKRLQLTLEHEVVKNIVISSLTETLHLDSSHLNYQNSFLSNGGHSIAAIEISGKCKAAGVNLSVETLLTCDSITECLKRAQITQEWTKQSPKRRRLSSIKKCYTDISLHDPGLPATQLPYNYESQYTRTYLEDDATDIQRQFVIDSYKCPGTNMIRFSQRFETQHIEVLKAAWNKVLLGESIFGSREKDQLEWSEHRCSSQEEMRRALETIPKESAVVSKFSTIVLKSHPEYTTIVWDVHHALIDGYSAKLLYMKVRKTAEGILSQPGTPFFQVARDLKFLQRNEFDLNTRFWDQEKLQHPQANGKFNMDLPQSAEISFQTSYLTLQTTGLQKWCTDRNITLATLHYSAWSLVLSNYIGSDTVIFGTVASGRTLPLHGAQDTIGPLVNTLPFYLTIDWSDSCEKHLRKVFRKLLRLQRVESSLPANGFSRDFDSAVAMEIEMPLLEELRIQPVEKSSFAVQTGIPMSVSFNSSGSVRFIYQDQRFNPHDIEILIAQYDEWITALTGFDQNLGMCASGISQKCYGGELLERGNLDLTTTTVSSIVDDLVTLFEGVAAQNPDYIAIKRENELITYSRLDSLAGKLAKSMENLVAPQDVVCVYADRSINWLIAIYAVLKVGAIYAPINLALPSSTQAINYRTAKAVLYLTPSAYQKESAPHGAKVLSVEEALSAPHTGSIPHRNTARPADAAYICFTSGSTGTPKAVVCQHRGLVAFQKDPLVRLQAKPGHAIAQVMSPAFDGSIHELFSTFSYGGTLVLASSSIDLTHLEHSDSAILTPSLARVLDPADYPRLKHVYLVGEPVPQQVCNNWAQSKRLFNMYGPTEATCGATIKELRPHNQVTIGKPNPSSRIYILDHRRRPCPPNVIGDIYIAGVQVAAGYLGLAELNASKFFLDPFCVANQERMYLTGDRGCWLHDGEIHCMGRSDRQVKLNGFRMDLNLLEEQIVQENPQLEAVALVKKKNYLQAAVVPASVDTCLIKRQLSEKLPMYSIPRFIFAMDSLPRTAISKIDYTAIEALRPVLPNAQLGSKSGQTETVIEAIWKDILNLDASVRVDHQSRFLELGGDSLTQLTLANRLSQTFGCEVSLRQVIELPTLRDLALAVEDAPQAGANETSALSQPGDVSILEADWYEKYQLGGSTSAFNVSLAWQFTPGTIDREKLAKAWDAVMRQNRIFSSCFIKNSNGQLNRGYHKVPPRAELVCDINIAEVVNSSFEMSNGHLVRVLIAPSKLLINISHILCDLTTMRTILQDVTFLYKSQLANAIPPIRAQGSIAQGEICPSDLEYWTETLRRAPLLRTWRNVGTRRSYNGRSDARWLTGDLLRKITKVSTEEKYTLHQLAIGATTLALQHDQEVKDLVLGAPFMNRRCDELSTLGLFLEPLPVRVRHAPSDGDSVSNFLDSVRKASQGALAHKIPWSKLVQHLGVRCSPPNDPFIDVMVTFHDFRQERLLPLDGLSQLQSWSTGSKFKLMAEFSATDDDSLMLRLEYDEDCFSCAEIDHIHSAIAEALLQLTTDTNIPAISRRLQSKQWSGPGGELVQIGDSIYHSSTAA